MQSQGMQSMLRQGAPVQTQSGYVLQGAPMEVSQGLPQGLMQGQGMVEVVQQAVPQGVLQNPAQGFLQPYSQGMTQMPAQSWLQTMPANYQQVPAQALQQNAQPHAGVFGGLPMNLMGLPWPQQQASVPQAFAAMPLGGQAAGPWVGPYQGAFALR